MRILKKNLRRKKFLQKLVNLKKILLMRIPKNLKVQLRKKNLLKLKLYKKTQKWSDNGKSKKESKLPKKQSNSKMLKKRIRIKFFLKIINIRFAFIVFYFTSNKRIILKKKENVYEIMQD
jgi:hypothetical protein